MRNAFFTRSGICVPVGSSLTAYQIDLGDICYSLAMYPAFNGHTVIQWSRACRALHMLEKAYLLPANEQFNRDQLLTIVFRDVRFVYSDVALERPLDEMLMEKFQFKLWPSDNQINNFVTSVIESEYEQLLRAENYTKCKLPNYVSPMIPVDKLRKEIRKIL